MNADEVPDCRRFKSLWREIFYARVLGSLAVAVAYFAAVDYTAGHGWFDSHWVDLPLIVVLAAIPSVAAKRGWSVFPLSALLCAVGAGSAHFSIDALGIGWRDETRMAFAASVAAGLGVAEGLQEKSIATTWVGLMGSALGTAIMFKALNAVVVGILINPPTWKFITILWVLFGSIHLSVALSLALGRWVRDIPKRKASSTPAASGPPPDGESPSDGQRNE